MVLYVFMVADHESVVRFAKFKMVDPIWRTTWRKFQKLRLQKILSYFT